MGPVLAALLEMTCTIEPPPLPRGLSRPSALVPDNVACRSDHQMVGNHRPLMNLPRVIATSHHIAQLWQHQISIKVMRCQLNLEEAVGLP